MIMGDTCTRLRVLQREDRPAGALDPNEPKHVAEAVAKLGFEPRGHHVGRSRTTSTTGGAQHFRAGDPRDPERPGDHHEVLTPDFLRKDGAAQTVGGAKPTCFNTISRPCRRNT